MYAFVWLEVAATLRRSAAGRSIWLEVPRRLHATEPARVEWHMSCAWVEVALFPDASGFCSLGSGPPGFVALLLSFGLRSVRWDGPPRLQDVSSTPSLHHSMFVAPLLFRGGGPPRPCRCPDVPIDPIVVIASGSWVSGAAHS